MIRGICPVGEEKVYDGKNLSKSQWKTEGVSGDESGDSEDDELPCVIWGKSKGDCIWRGSRGEFIP